MTYFEIQDHHGAKIGSRFYFTIEAARAVANRTTGKWRKNNDKRGNGMKIVLHDDSLYSQVVEWVFA